MKVIKNRKKYVLAALLGSLLLFANFSGGGDDCSRGAEDLSVAVGEIFAGSGKCVACHDTDTTFQVMVDPFGNDVSMINDWMATMMANSARDPLWKAKVEHETLIAPDHATIIESTCTRCHAPMGNYEAQNAGVATFTMEDLASSELGQDGVSCTVCHTITENSPGGEFSGILEFNHDNLIYGPFADPWGGPMISQTGYAPVHSDHVLQSEICASCHTLITETIDLEGEFTGNTFVEQATYHEWLNSNYSSMGTECQTCHMPEVDEGVIVANQPNWLFPQSPFGRHHFVGGNTFMLGLMKTNRELLGLPATTEQFEMVEARTREYLQTQTAEMEILATALVHDTLVIELLITNKAGHKFPSGYPSRIAWLEILATSSFGDTLFHSGRLNEENRITGRDIPFELHHDIIDDSEDVLIYEMVMQDVAGEVTTVLVRAELPVKDNRLVPLGFQMEHEVYDTVLVAGSVLLDENFNNHDGPGSGTDQVTIKIPFEDYTGELAVEMKLNYQSVPSRWLDEMFAESGMEIDNFKLMFEEADKSPEVVASIEYNRNVYVPAISGAQSLVVPNPTSSGFVELWYDSSLILSQLIAYNSIGQEIALDIDLGNYPIQIKLPESSGLYYLLLDFGTSEEVIKVLRIRQ